LSGPFQILILRFQGLNQFVEGTLPAGSGLVFRFIAIFDVATSLG
jgi:hypothetical protein